MVGELSYLAVSTVVSSWEIIRRVDDYQAVAGVILFKKLFEMDSSAQEVFRFSKETNLSDDFFKSPVLMRHAKHFLNMMDRAIGLLGPDSEMLTDIMLQLGKRHASFGVKPAHFPLMGQALLDTIEELLGDKFTEEVKDSWVEVYQALSYDMIRAYNDRSYFVCSHNL